MKKMPSIYLRDFSPGGDPSRVTRERNPEATWVFAGEGVATIKRDGTACMIRNGRLFRRYDAKRGKTPPAGFEPCGDPDPKTEHAPGWLPVGDGPEDRWMREARDSYLEVPEAGPIPDGTYEAVGPKIQGNPEGFDRHILIRHGAEPFPSPQTDFDALSARLGASEYEGIVWHHPDGRMAKIKTRDFGHAWAGPKKSALKAEAAL